jgi:hypothetical protein
MKASLTRLLHLLLALCTMNMATCFTTQPTFARPNTALMAGGRTRKAVKGIFQKFGFDKKKDYSGAVVSGAAMAKAAQNADKYSKIDDVEERAFQVLLDLGLVEKTK